MENRKSNGLSLTKGKIFALICLVVFSLAFIFACLKSVLPLGAGLVGTFGVMLYPALILLALLSLAKFLGFSYRRSIKATVLMGVFILSLLMVIHCIRTFRSLDAVATGKTYGEYLGLSYEKLTVLGSFGSIFAGLLSLLFGGFGAIIVFAILATIMIGLFIDFELYGKYEEKHIKKLKSRKLRSKVSRSEEGEREGRPNYSFSEEKAYNGEYSEADIVSEITSEASEYSNAPVSNYTENDAFSEVEENVNDYGETGRAYSQNSIDESYKNINFFGSNAAYNNGYNDTLNEQQVNGGYGQNVNGNSGAPAFSNEVYEEEHVPNVFTDSMDEYRRKFLEDTFGMPSYLSNSTNNGYSNNSNNSYENITNNSANSSSNFASSSVSESNGYEQDYGFNSSFSSASEPPKQESQSPLFNQSFESEKPTFSFNSTESSLSSSSETLSSKPETSFSDSEPVFPGMIGSSIDDTPNFSGTSFSFESPKNDFELSSSLRVDDQEVGSSNFSLPEDDDDSDLQLNNSISSIFNISDEDDENEGSIVNAPLESLTSKPSDINPEPKSELTDFSFLRKSENEGLVSPEEMVKNDVSSASKFSEPLFAENSVKSTNEGLIITSVNPVEPPKVTVQAKEPVKKFSYNLGMNGIRYNPPPLSLLVPSKPDNGDYTEEQQRKSAMLEESLKAFNVPAKVVNIIRGPKITRYELSVPLGVPVKKIPMYELDIKRALAAKTINIQAPIPGSSYVGVELENDTFTSVSERELLESEAFQNCKDPLPIAVGKDISGEIVVKSLAKMVHLLIAGSTGSGKSVFIHSIVMSLIYKHSPEDLRLIMIDPKKVEFNRYNGLPHLLTPEVVMGADKAINALKWCVKEMDRRYDLMSKSGYNNIEPYNRSELVKAGQFEKFPYIVIIVDELAEIMMANKKEVEACIQRITQLARACGMHLILATQRPSVDIISGVIKNNVPSRIAFSLSSGIDSKTILNTVGAEKLLGQGDMLFSPNGTSSMPRLQAAYCSDEEIKAVIDFDKQNNSANYDDTVSSVINAEPQPEGEYAGQINDAPAPRELDSYFKTALKLVMQNGGASTSYLQRRLSIGYSRAAKIMDQMEDKGYIAPATGSKVRKVLITPDEFRDEFGEDYSDISDI